MHQIAVGKDEALASAHRWWANQWRILLSALASTLLEALRRFALKGSALARATVATIRLKLIKIGAVSVRKASVIRIHLSSHHPLKDLLPTPPPACLLPNDQRSRCPGVFLCQWG